MVGKNVVIGGFILLVILAGLSAGVAAQSEDGLVAKWYFDEGSGSIAKGNSGNETDEITALIVLPLVLFLKRNR